MKNLNLAILNEILDFIKKNEGDYSLEEIFKHINEKYHISFIELELFTLDSLIYYLNILINEKTRENNNEDDMEP